MIRKIFIKAITLLIIFLLISLFLQDNSIWWGIFTGMFLSVINFYLLYSLIKIILNTKNRWCRILATLALPFKLIATGGLMALSLLYTSVHWLGLLISINFVLLLVIWEGLFGKEKFHSKEAECFGTRT